MYLLALITKWRNKGIQFIIESPALDKFEITAAMTIEKRYISIITQDLEQGCKFIDAGLSEKFKGDAVDNNHANS